MATDESWCEGWIFVDVLRHGLWEGHDEWYETARFGFPCGRQLGESEFLGRNRHVGWISSTLSWSSSWRWTIWTCPSPSSWDRYGAGLGMFGDVWGHGPEKCCCFLSFSHSRIFTFQIKHLWNRLICKPWMDKIWIFWRLTTVSYSFMIWIFKAFESCTDTLFRTVRPGGGSREIKSQPFAADYSRCPRAFLTCNHQSQRWCDSEIHFWFLHLQFDDFMTWVLDSFHRCSLACPESVVSRFQDSRPKFGVT